MRNLTSIQSADTVIADFSIEITATDASTTFVFSTDNIVNISPLRWEVPFGGGIGKTSNYSITLSSSDSFIKDNFKKLLRANTTLKVLANSDYFYPHVGRARQVRRFGNNPNLFSIEVFDRFLDTNPYFPPSIQDSYTTLHPEVIAGNITQGVYYGKHHRRPYLTPVNCDISSLLGPKGVSFDNHVTSCFFIPKPDDPSISLMTKFSWRQESTSTNDTTSCFPFELSGAEGAREHKLMTWGDPLSPNYPQIESKIISNNGYAKYVTVNSQTDVCYINPRINKHPSLSNHDILAVSFLRGDILFEGRGSTPDGLGNIQVRNSQNSNSIIALFTNTNSTGYSFNVNVASWQNFGQYYGRNILSEDWVQQTYLNGYQNNGDGSRDASIFTCSMEVDLQLFSVSYKNYSIFAEVVNSSDIAVSENPVHILTHIFSEYTATPFVQSQASDSQYDVNSYKFQCGFYEREPLNKIIHEFGEQTATNMWIGDSGQLNFRTYQESATLTNSSLVNFTLTTSDLINFDLISNPLGSSQYNAQKSKRVRVSYDYDFTRGVYKNSLQADPLNNSFCDSANAVGIENEQFNQSKYMLVSDVATYYLGNRVRFFTQDETFITATLPAKFFQMEVADFVKIQHPVLIGSESLFQVTDVSMDLLNGLVQIKASEILNGSGD